MKTKDLSTLKINKLTQAQYDKALQEGRINENELYLTPGDNVEFDNVKVGDTNISNNEIYMGDPLLIGKNENGGFVITEEVGSTDKAKMTPTKISVENEEGYSEITPYEVSNNYADRTVRFCAEEDCIEIIDKSSGDYMHLRKDEISYKKDGFISDFKFPKTQGETLLVGRDLIDIKPNTILLNKTNDNVIQQYDSYYKEKFNVYKFDNDRSEGSGYMDFGDTKVCTTINSMTRPIWNSGSENKQLATLDDIPTKTSQLTNDSNFLTQHQSLEALIPLSQKGSANGVASLDANGFIPSSQLPSYVDDVLEYTSKSSFPTTGTTGKIYVDTSTNLTYRWGGTSYVEISSSLALGETSSTAYAGDKGKANADAIADLQSGKLDKSSVVNNLTSTSTSSALSAAQGKALNDKFANYLTTSSANSTYQTKLTSGTNIKTINGQSLLGSGNITISGGSGGGSFNGGDITNNVNILNDKSLSFYDPFGTKKVEIDAATGAKFTNSSVYITGGILSVKGSIHASGITPNDDNMGSVGSPTKRFHYMYATNIVGSDGVEKAVSDIALKSDITTSGGSIDKLVNDKNLGFGFNSYNGRPGIQLGEDKLLGISSSKDNFDSPISIKFPSVEVDGITTLVAREELKTINGQSLIGSGDITISGGSGSGSGGFNGGDITNDLNIKNGKALNVYDPFGYKIASINSSWGIEMTNNYALYIGTPNGATTIRLGSSGLINKSGNGFKFKNDGSIFIASGSNEILFPNKSGTLATLEDLGDINSILDILNGEVV